MMPDDVLASIRSERLVLVVRSRSAADAARTVEAAVEGGIRIVEVTYTIPGASQLIQQLRQEFGDDVTVGAGTVLTTAQVAEAVGAGASFLVSPGLDEEVLASGLERSVLTIPGTFSVSEMMRAVGFGASAVKLFPAYALCPGYVRSLLVPLPGLSVMPSGGISAENAKSWLDAGAIAVGIGGALSPLGVIDDAAHHAITSEAQRIVAVVAPTA